MEKMIFPHNLEVEIIFSLIPQEQLSINYFPSNWQTPSYSAIYFLLYWLFSLNPECYFQLCPLLYPNIYVHSRTALIIPHGCYIHIPKYLNSICSVCIVLLVCVFSRLIIWYLSSLPRQDRFSCSQHSLIACSSLCRGKT